MDTHDEKTNTGKSGQGKNNPKTSKRTSQDEVGRHKPRVRPDSWFARNRTDLRFLLIFAVSLLVFYAGTLTDVMTDGFFPAYLRLNAQASGIVLRAVGEDVTVVDKSLISARGPSIQVERGCDAVAPSALFVSAVLASPVAIVPRLLAAVGGVVLLMLLNLVRVISLFLVRLYYPKAFDVVHLDVWQVLFILMAILFWALWASWASKTKVAPSHATA